MLKKNEACGAHALGRSEFIKICLEETHHVEQEFKQLWQRMGLSIEWDKCYSTISASTRAISQESFIELYNKGFIYRAYEPALYCTTCRTSVAQAELDDIEQDSFFNDIVFHDERGNDLIIGTTRPELLPSCVALVYNPADTRYQHLKGMNAIVPLFGHRVPIVEDESVDIDKGTGLVMCCTFGDKADIAWFKKFKLPYKQSIGFDGRWMADTGVLAGLTCHEARKKVLEELTKATLLLRQKPITHAVNVHERCKREIEYVALSQWFLKILPYKKELIALADSIAWYPSFMKARYTNWVENISWDWCLSRQRLYGIPFPVWHCASCGHVLLATPEMLPVDPQETLYKGTCTNCSSTDIKPDTDVMDTWNTSSLTPYLCYKYFNPAAISPFRDPRITSFIPMSMRPQAHDIIRTWAFYTITKVWMHHATVPWKEIVISGHVLGDAQQKLSKSQGGGKLTPEALLQQYPADVIRFWTASGNLGYDIAFSENQLKIGLKLVTKLWNAFRFTKEHIASASTEVPTPDALSSINQWLLHEVSVCFAEYKTHLDQNEFGLALHRIETFFWTSFCDTYIELVKHQLFQAQAYAPETVAATRWTLSTVGMRILQMYAPYVPYVTEAIYTIIYRASLGHASLHQTKFTEHQTLFVFADGVQRAQVVIAIVEQVRKLKTEKQLSLKVELARLEIVTDNIDAQYALREQEQLLKGVTQAREIVFVSSTFSTADMTERDGAWYAVVGL